MSSTTASHLDARALPPLNMLRAFDAVARHLSVTRAAQALCVTPGAVSHQVKALEDWLGLALVMREGRHLALTPAGRQYAAEVVPALDRLAEATLRLRTPPARPSLTVCVMPSFATQWLIPRLSDFCAQWPAVDVHLVTTAPHLDFDPLAYDLSLRCLSEAELAQLRLRTAWQAVRLGVFMADALTPVCSLAYAQAQGVHAPADLPRLGLVHSRSTPMAWPDWVMQAGVSGVDVQAGSWFDHVHQAVQAAAQGLGLAVASWPVVRHLPGLTAPWPDLALRTQAYHWIRPPRSGPVDDLAQAFADWLCAQGADDGPPLVTSAA